MAADSPPSDPPVSISETVATSPTPKKKRPTAGQVLVVTSVMFTFISFWRTAAIVLCDLASTAYYIGGIVESQIGRAAPWFILGVMLFSYAVRSIYIESCAMFVRGGVYRIVKEAMGGGMARLAVSALLFDFILTGPVSSVTAGQYIIGLVNDVFELGKDSVLSDYKNVLASAIAILVTVYFWRVNIKGIHESSDRALKIMMATTVMGVVMIVWCLVTIAVDPQKRSLPTARPDLSKKVDQAGKPMLDPFGKQVDPLGFAGETSLGYSLRPENLNGSWLSFIGAIGIVLSFGHSILAMSGEETLAQVYREVESPKLKNFKRAALVVFVYSLLFTSLISFFAVMIIPDGVRMSRYSDNLIGGLAMNVVGPQWARLVLNGIVVVVGFLILSGAVNTAIVGSNGVLNRVSEDGVLPDWFLKPHPRFGTSSRMINLVVVLQIVTIVFSRGDVLALGEAYAFGVIWSFVFMSLSMLILRFKRPEHREYEVPFNIHVGRFDIPLGMTFIFLVLAVVAVANLFTKEVATITGVLFTAGFFAVFWVSEHAHRRRVGKAAAASHEHLEQFIQEEAEQLSTESLNVTKPYRKLVAIRSPFNLAMLERCLDETDPETTDVVVMTATVLPIGSADLNPMITVRDRQLLTAVVNLAEHAGKPVKPVIVPTNEPFFAMARTAKTIGAQELIMGQSNKFRPEDQLDQIALYWFNVCGATPEPLSIRVLAKDRDVRLDIAGGSQIPKIGMMAAGTAQILSELRKSWHGVERLLLAYDGSPLSIDFLDTVMSFLDPAISVTLMDVAENGSKDDHDSIEEAKAVAERAAERARALGRQVEWRVARGEAGREIVQAAIDGKFDAIFMSLRGVYRRGDTTAFASNTRYVLEHAPCRVILGFAPKSIPAAPPDGKVGV
jgi:amino acid transporter/nucleotide-binding universal stress UspA family protein